MSYRIPALTYEVCLTDKCNLACKYCFEKDKGRTELDAENLRDIIENPLTNKFYLFGGEPFLATDFIKKFLEILYASDLPANLKESLKNSANKHTTNGTLLKKNIDLIKDYRFNLQISLDGPKEINDINRVDCAGNGTFDRIMENVEEVKKYDIPFHFHGVVNKESLPHLFDILKFFFTVTEKFQGREIAIKALSGNQFMFVMEEDYTDEDIDIAIQQYGLFFDWLHENLSETEEIEAIKHLCAKRGGICGAGTGLLVLGTDNKIHPCHRTYGNEGKEENSLGDSFTDYPKNTQVYNNFFRSKSGEYTFTVLGKVGNFQKGFLPQTNYCPTTYKEISDTMFYIPPVYFVFVNELAKYLLYKAEEKGISIEEIKKLKGV